MAFMGFFVSVAGGVTTVMVSTNCGKNLSRDINGLKKKKKRLIKNAECK